MSRLPLRRAGATCDQRVVLPQRPLPAADVGREQRREHGERERARRHREAERSLHDLAPPLEARRPELVRGQRDGGERARARRASTETACGCEAAGRAAAVPARTTGAPPVSRLKNATSLLDGIEADDAQRDVVALEREHDRREPRQVARVVVEVADEDRDRLAAAGPGTRSGARARARAEIFVPALKVRRPRIGRERLREAGAVRRRQREIADERREIGRGRSRRQRLVRLVGEDDEPVAAVAPRERRERRADARVRVGGDARRDVEDDDRRRVRGQRDDRLRVRVSRDERGGDDERRRALRRARSARERAASRPGEARRRRRAGSRSSPSTFALDLRHELRERVGRRRGLPTTRGRSAASARPRIARARAGARAARARGGGRAAAALRLAGERERALEAGQRRGRPAPARRPRPPCHAGERARRRGEQRRDDVEQRARAVSARPRYVTGGGVVSLRSGGCARAGPQATTRAATLSAGQRAVARVRARDRRRPRGRERDRASRRSSRGTARRGSSRARCTSTTCAPPRSCRGHARAPELRERREVLARRARPSRAVGDDGDGRGDADRRTRRPCRSSDARVQPARGRCRRTRRRARRDHGRRGERRSRDRRRRRSASPRPPAHAAAARPTRRTRGRSRTGRSCRARPARGRATRARSSSAREPRLVPRAQRRAPRARERRTSSTRPLARIARSARATPATSGKLCSQTGSWMTTGTTSQPCATASSHASGGGGARKSERTNTNVPGRQVAAQAARGTRAPASRLSSGASNGAARLALLHEPRRRRGAPAAASTRSPSPKSSDATSRAPRSRSSTSAAVASTTARGFESHGSDDA